MKKGIAAIVVFFSIMLFFSCSQKGKNAEDTYSSGKTTLKKVEVRSPEKFISVSCSHKKNILGQIVVSGKMVNTGALATYTDIELMFSFFDKSGNLIDEARETFADSLKRGQSLSFRKKFSGLKQTDSVAVKVNDAKGN